MWWRKILCRWVRGSVDGLHIFLAASLMAVWIAGWQGEMEWVKSAAYWGMGGLILVHLIHWGLASCGDFLELYEETDRLPAKQIQMVCRIFLGFLLAALGLFIVVLPNLELGGLWRTLGNGILRIIRFLLSFLPEGSGEAAAQTGGTMSAMTSPLLSEGGEPALWVEILEIVVQVLVSLGLAALAVWGLYRLFGRFREWFAKSAWDGDEKIFLAPEVHKERAKTKKEKGFRLFPDQSYSGRVRRLYKRTLKRAAKGNLSASATPTELEQAAGLSFPEGGLHDLYEKARYSETGAKREDWERLSGKA